MGNKVSPIEVTVININGSRCDQKMTELIYHLLVAK